LAFLPALRRIDTVQAYSRTTDVDVVAVDNWRPPGDRLGPTEEDEARKRLAAIVAIFICCDFLRICEVIKS
jgi:hypothetical protein